MSKKRTIFHLTLRNMFGGTMSPLNYTAARMPLNLCHCMVWCMEK